MLQDGTFQLNSYLRHCLFVFFCLFFSSQSSVVRRIALFFTLSSSLRRLGDPAASRHGLLPVPRRRCVRLHRAPAGPPQPGPSRCGPHMLLRHTSVSLPCHQTSLFHFALYHPSVPHCRQEARLRQLGPAGSPGGPGSQPPLAGADRQRRPALPLPVPPLPKSGEPAERLQLSVNPLWVTFFCCSCLRPFGASDKWTQAAVVARTCCVMW